MSITYEVLVDWNATNWLSAPDFSQGIDDITGYVKTIYTDRGKKVELGNIPAGTLDVTLNNADKRFSPTYASSPIVVAGEIRPWLPVQVWAIVTGGSPISFFAGFISKISVNPHKSVQEAYLYCTDGMDLLARNMVAVNKSDRSMVSDGEAIGNILDGAGWPSAKRSIDVDGGKIVNYPTTAEY